MCLSFHLRLRLSCILYGLDMAKIKCVYTPHPITALMHNYTNRNVDDIRGVGVDNNL